MKTKICSKCKKRKKICDFYKDKSHKDGLRAECSTCSKTSVFNYQNQNRKKLNAQAKTFYVQYKKLFPWFIYYRSAKDRCNNVNATGYKYYGGRGIKFLLTMKEVKKLWFRDKAFEMKKPSLNRKNNDGNYVFENCEFIEKSKNIMLAHIKPILQFDLKGNFIKEWTSAVEVENQLKINRQNISCCANQKPHYLTAGGFIWKFKSKENQDDQNT